MPHLPEQVHNHNPGSVTLNYPCPVSQLRVVSHNKAKRREAGHVSKITFLSTIPMQVYNTTFDPGWGPDPPQGLGGPPSMFLALMVGTPGFFGSTSHGAHR
jgi:hypothetical protein